MKRILLPLALAASVATLSAGGYLTNTNHHVSFLRNPARNASIELDALYSNPAGVAFLPEGWHLSLSLQSAYQNRDVKGQYPLFSYNADGRTNLAGERLFTGRAKAPIIPSIFLAYKKGQWTFGGHLAIAGGGGNATFAYGLPSFERNVSVLPVAFNQVIDKTQAPFEKATRYQYESQLTGGQIIYSGTVGAAYRINQNWSVYAGVRTNIARNNYSGYLRNIQLEMGGKMTPLSPFLKAGAAQAQAASAQYAAAGDQAKAMQFGALAKVAEEYAASTADKAIELSQSGVGFTPILGINYTIGDLHLAAKYEFNTNIKTTNKTERNDFRLPEYEDKVESRNDMPAILALGMTYKVLPDLRLSAGYTHYFNKQARMPGDKQKTLKGGTHEWQAGAEYDLNQRLMLSAGVQITNYGQTPAFQSDLSFHNDSYSVGMGFRYMLTDKIKLNVAYLLSQYEQFSTTGKAHNVDYKTTYIRTNHVFGIGADFTF